MLLVLQKILKIEKIIQKLAQKLNVICVSEIHTNITNLKLINLPGYNFCCNNSASRAGESGIYVSKNLPNKELFELHMNLPDCKDA